MSWICPKLIKFGNIRYAEHMPTYHHNDNDFEHLFYSSSPHCGIMKNSRYPDIPLHFTYFRSSLQINFEKIIYIFFLEKYIKLTPQYREMWSTWFSEYTNRVWELTRASIRTNSKQFPVPIIQWGKPPESDHFRVPFIWIHTRRTAT